MTLPTVLVADDDRSIRTVLTQALGRSGYQVRSTGNAATLWRWVEDGEGDLVITDVVMPDENGLDLIPRIKRIRPELRIVVMSAQSTLITAVKATQRGAFEYLPKPFDLRELLAVVARALAAPTEPPMIVSEPRDTEERLPLIGRSPSMQEIYRTIARLTTADLTVMINGESGTGKELVARALHDYGKRRAGSFVAINMAAIPRELIESELFGHERGAFTGATNRSQGRFEQANGGTLVPRRDWRHAAGGADPPVAGVAGRRIHQRRRPPADQGQCPDHRRHPSRLAHLDSAGAVPGGFVLPPERGADPPAAAARARRGHPAAGPPLPGPGTGGRPAVEEPGSGRRGPA